MEIKLLSLTVIDENKRCPVLFIKSFSMYNNVLINEA